MRPYNPSLSWFRLFRFRSPLLSESLLPCGNLISLPGVREMVQFPQYCFRRLCIQRSDDRLSSAGLPHSAIQASQDVCSSTWLFAAYHGLLRLATPRHPPMNPSSLDHIIVPALTSVRTSSCPSLSTHSFVSSLSNSIARFPLPVCGFLWVSSLSPTSNPHLPVIQRPFGDKGIRTPDLRLAKPPL